MKTNTRACKLVESNQNDDTCIDCMDEYSIEIACESLSPCPQTQLIKFEYHVLYHISYAVPYLCFNAYKSSMFENSLIKMPISRRKKNEIILHSFYLQVVQC